MTQDTKRRLLTTEELKSGGFIPQRQKDLVAVRCRAPGGRLTGAKLRKLADVAEKFGDGTVHLSVRMSPEILYVNMKDLTSVIEELGSLWHSPIAHAVAGYAFQRHAAAASIIREDGQIRKNLQWKLIGDILVQILITSSK